MLSKIVVALTILFASAHLTESWVAQAIYHNADHPGKCFVNQNLILSPGQSAKSPEGCSEIRCYSENGNAQIAGCGAIAPPEGCEWNGYENINADYPLCCAEKFICKDPADEPNAKRIQENVRKMLQKTLESKQKV